MLPLHIHGNVPSLKCSYCQARGDAIEVQLYAHGHRLICATCVTDGARRKGLQKARQARERNRQAAVGDAS